jgi:ferredoxin hydrogenase gamma subunit
VDLVLTVQEFAAMLDRRGIDLMSLEPAEFDSPFMSEGSGAAQLFATTGGVMEAALRTGGASLLTSVR